MGAHVIFIGGYKASPDNVKKWKASALEQKPGLIVDPYPYPDASANGGKAVEAFEHFDEAIRKIQSSLADKIFIVGHSSGCAIANALDAKLKNHDKISLVALDGYSPSNDQLARPTTQVWIADSPTGQSLHFGDLTGRLEGYDKKFPDRPQIEPNVHHAPAACSTKLALHFSLVNLSSSDDLVKTIPQGYTDCKAMLEWLT